MSNLFISDLHLSVNQPALARLFLSFLQIQAKKAEALYILGDLFETWIGDDHHTSFNQQIIAAMAELTASGVKTYFMPGNRDFLIGQRFIEKTGFKLLEDPSLIKLYGITTLLTHGDKWCTRDKLYIYYRHLARMRFLQLMFLSLPLSLRKTIANYLRDKKHVTTNHHSKYDIVMNEMYRCLQTNSAQLIVHGHTHQPCIQLFQTPNQFPQTLKHSKFHTRIVLSDWNPHQGNMLVVTPDKRFELNYFT